MTSSQAPAPSPAPAPAPVPPPALSILSERTSKILCDNEFRAAQVCSDLQEKVAEVCRRLAVAEADLQHYQAGLWGGYDQFRVVTQQKLVDELQQRRQYRYGCLQRALAVLQEHTARKARVASGLAKAYQKKRAAGQDLSAIEEATARRLYGQPYVVNPHGGWDGLFRLDPETSPRLIRRRLEGSCLFMYE